MGALGATSTLTCLSVKHSKLRRYLNAALSAVLKDKSNLTQVTDLAADVSRQTSEQRAHVNALPAD
jgi:hypothetical protein